MKAGSCSMGDDSEQGSWWLFLLFSPQIYEPQTPLKHLQSTLPSLCWSPSKVAANEILCIDPLRGFLHLQPPLYGRQKPCCFSQLDVFWVPFLAVLLQAGEPSLGFRPDISQGKPPGHPNIPLDLLLPPVEAQPSLSCLLHTPYQFHCGEVGFFDSLSMVIRLLSTQGSLCYSGCFSTTQL